MKQGDMVLIDYVGKTDGEIFDLTVEEKAKEEGMYSEDIDYSPIPVLIGESYVIPGLEENLEDMEEGGERDLEVEADKAYGSRDSENIETYPEKEFKQQGVQVRPGEEIMVGNRRGRVVSKGSGRVRIDFNHPLAGKDLEYWVKITEKVDDEEKIAEYIAQHVAGHFNYEVNEGVLEVEETHSHGEHEHEIPEEIKEELERQVEEYTDLEVEYI